MSTAVHALGTWRSRKYSGGRLDSAAATVDDGLTISRNGSDAACRVALGLAAIGVATARGDAAGTGAALQQLDAIQVQAGELYRCAPANAASTR